MCLGFGVSRAHGSLDRVTSSSPFKGVGIYSLFAHEHYTRCACLPTIILSSRAFSSGCTTRATFFRFPNPLYSLLPSSSSCRLSLICLTLHCHGSVSCRSSSNRSGAPSARTKTAARRSTPKEPGSVIRGTINYDYCHWCNEDSDT
jgi:hypothetical protein